MLQIEIDMKFKDIKKYKPVEIDIKNATAYTQIAYLVDSPFFLWDIQAVRDQFHIEKIFKYGDYQLWNNHLYQLADFDLDELKEINSKNDDQAKIAWKKTKEYEYEKLDELRGKFSQRIAVIRELYRYPRIFDDVIQQAVLFNKISEFKTAYATILRSVKKSSPDNESKFDADLAIILTPNALQKDVLDAYQEAMRLRPNYELYNPLYIELDSNPDHTERDRLWFWAKYRDEKPSKDILDEWNKKCPRKQDHSTDKEVKNCEHCSVEDINIVDQAISRYKKKIQFLFREKSDN